MSIPAADANPPPDSNNDEAKHAALVAAARRVVARDGAAQLSPALVAREANCTPEIVARHFRSKHELLVALAAEDLNSLAGAMRNGAVPDAESGWEAAAPADVARTETAPPAEPPRLIRRSRVMSTELDDIMKQLAPSDPAAGGTQIAKLERRMSLLEQALQEANERHDKAAKAAAAAIENDALALRKRFETLEAAHQDVAAKWGGDMVDVLARLQRIETGAVVNASPYALYSPLEEPAAPAAPLPDPNQIVLPLPEFETPAPAAVMDKGDGPESYLTAARRAANEALKNQPEKHPQPTWLKRFMRTRVLMVGCAVPALVLTATALLINQNQEGVALASVVAPPGSAVTHMSKPPVSADTKIGKAEFDEIELLAGAGDPASQVKLGLAYMRGTGVAADPAQAARWLLRAAYLGDATAQYWLGTLYAKGQGVPADQAAAAHWFETAAKHGNLRAMHSVGVAYYEGSGVAKDATIAARWFTKAAEAGLADSQFNLAVLYEEGSGVGQSLPDAYKWYAIAARQGDKPATERMSVLEKQLGAADLVLAKRAADTFKPAAN